MSSAPVSGPAEVCTDAAGAAERTAVGIDVVLILPEGVPWVDPPPGPGRVAVLVGRADDETAQAAAAAMSAELFDT